MEYGMTMTPACFVSNVTDSFFKEDFFIIDETSKGWSFSIDQCPKIVLTIINYKVKSAPFSSNI